MPGTRGSRAQPHKQHLCKGRVGPLSPEVEPTAMEAAQGEGKLVHGASRCPAQAVLYLQAPDLSERRVWSSLRKEPV